jgi:hypothetical protein
MPSLLQGPSRIDNLWSNMMALTVTLISCVAFARSRVASLAEVLTHDIV